MFYINEPNKKLGFKNGKSLQTGPSKIQSL